MPSSKEMQPLTIPFFPNIFFQNQFRSKPTWPPKDTDLTGKTVMVTGANQGLGFEASDQLLALRVSRLILAVRLVSKGEAAADVLRAKYPNAVIDVYQLDMSSYDSIRAFVAQVEQLPRLDIAILNAGVRKMKFALIPSTGHEETIQINYLSTMLLCILLLPVLRRKSADDPGRISIVSSGLAFQSKFGTPIATPLLPSFDDPKTFDALDRYNTSKLLGMMFLYKIADYVSPDDVVVNAVDPGFVRGTGLSREVPLVAGILMGLWKDIAARSLRVGASTYVDGTVLQGKGSHGSYIMSWKISPFPGLLYTVEGRQAIETLWQETMAELRFADVRGVLNALRKA